jgi:hypothetical protein
MAGWSNDSVLSDGGQGDRQPARGLPAESAATTVLWWLPKPMRLAWRSWNSYTALVRRVPDEHNVDAGPIDHLRGVGVA